MASKARKPNRYVSRLRLGNWRNFVRADVELSWRTFLVGPNAAGKSNFLDVFRFLHDLVAVGGGFEEAINRRGGVSSIRALAGRYPSHIAIELDIRSFESDEEKPEWAYILHFSQDKQRRPVIKKESVLRFGEQIFSRPDRDDENDPQRLRQTFLEQVNVNLRFREIATFLQSIRYLHIVPQLVRDSDRYVGRGEDPYGGDFLEQIASVTEQTRRSRLKRIESALRVAVPQLSEIELWRDVKGRPHLRGRYSHWRPKGAWQTEDQFSDGTLRLMGLLWAVLEGNGPLLLEEPELSLHPEVSRYIPQMLARLQRKIRRQILLSTHSADLLSDEGLGLNEVLLLLPGREGTEVVPAGSIGDVRILLQNGASMAEVVIPQTRPEGAEQLSLFGDRG